MKGDHHASPLAREGEGGGAADAAAAAGDDDDSLGKVEVHAPTLRRARAHGLGEIALANIAQAAGLEPRYLLDVSVSLCPHARGWPSDGVLLHRMEDEDGLFFGMKDLYSFLVVERGSSEMWHRGRVHQVRPGDIVVGQPGEIYRDLRHDGPGTFDVVMLDNMHIEAARAARAHAGSMPAAPVLAAGDPRARPLLALRAALAAPTTTLARDVAIAEASTALVDGEGNAAARSSERPAVARAVTYLRDRVAQRVRIDDLADHVRLDKHHLIRAFRADIGVPPYEYLTHLRMSRARQLLRGGMPPAEVAASLGYYDQSQLHRHFVRVVGTTPGAFAASERTRRAM